MEFFKKELSMMSEMENDVIEKSYEMYKVLQQAGMLEDKIRERFPSISEMSDYKELKQANILHKQTYEKLMKDCLKIKTIIEELKNKPIDVSNDNLFVLFSPAILFIGMLFIIIFTDSGLSKMQWLIDLMMIIGRWIYEKMMFIQLNVIDRLIEQCKLLIA